MFRQREPPGEEALSGLLRQHGRDLIDTSDLDPILEGAGDARVVMIGEASHGTHEFYVWRERLTRRLIEEKGFSFVAVEGDWPDCQEVDRYVKGSSDAGEARQAVRAFRRWPTWMWANREVAAFAEWLRERNERAPPERRVGFHGLDVYSLWESLDAIEDYLEREDPEALVQAREAFRCFAPYARDEQEYARATVLVPASCEREVMDLLLSMRRRAAVAAPQDEEAHFDAEQNALVAKNAETYYRTMIRGGPQSWNVRDHHMMETLQRLLHRYGPHAKAVVWEHNTHIGDARFTDMESSGMINIGQLAREAYGEEDVFLVGFGTYRGSVIAGEHWGAPMESMSVPEARAGSWEHAFHLTGPEDRIILSEDFQREAVALDPRGHRAIGVVYDPAHDQWGNYVPTVLPRRYDAYLHIERTHALHPFHLYPEPLEVPETYPYGD